MEKNEKIPQYGDPKYVFTLGWHDINLRDYLVVTDYKLKSEVMNARAKGTTVYELIDLYGGVDNVSEAFSAKNEASLYGDGTLYPEFGNDESYAAALLDLQSQIDRLKAANNTITAEEKGGAEEK